MIRGQYKNPEEEDYLKLASSAIKNVLTFCLAYQGTLVYTTDEVLFESEKKFGALAPIRDLMELKKQGRFSMNVIINSYNIIETIYQGVVRK